MYSLVYEINYYNTSRPLHRWVNLLCLGALGRVVELEGDVAKVDFGGVVREVDATLTPEVKIGDYVIVHAGTIISIVDEEEALETLKLVEELSKYYEGEDGSVR